MKLKPQELRIGNLLQDSVSKTHLEVVKLTKENIVTYVIDRSKFPLKDGWSLEPIPLNEEWLLKLGYKTTQGHYVFKNHCVLNVKDILTCNKSGVVLKYVHQLQNMYFSFNELMTSEELILKAS